MAGINHLQIGLDRRERADWVAEHLIPCEAQIRGWMDRWRVSADDKDELLQEGYCRIAMLPSVAQIEKPGAYFFSIIRNLLAQKFRRQRIVSFEMMAEIDSYSDERQSFEDDASYRMAYAKILELIDRLPSRCREIVQLRKIEDWPLKQIADHLGISEKTVEAQIRLGLRAIRSAWYGVDAEPQSDEGPARTKERHV